MSERMTGVDVVGVRRMLRGALTFLPDGKEEVAETYLRMFAAEMDRARASEVEKDATIKALADALERHGWVCRVANPANPCFCVGCETRSALRLCGRL